MNELTLLRSGEGTDDTVTLYEASSLWMTQFSVVFHVKQS